MGGNPSRRVEQRNNKEGKNKGEAIWKERKQGKVRLENGSSGKEQWKCSV